MADTATPDTNDAPRAADDPYDLQRFVDAQQGVHEEALRELRAGRKHSHWMWFVFPQLRGLGHSPMAVRYGVASLDEARAYLAHPVLGPRIEAAALAALESPGRTVAEIFGSPDDMKFRSSMTLFAMAAVGESVFRRALAGRCGDAMDERTLEMLATSRD